MPANAWVSFAAAEVTLLFTLALVRRLARSRSLYLASWSAALLFFTVGAGALWYGSAFGWSGVSFRTYYVFGALLGVPFLALGQVQLLVTRRSGELAALLVAFYCAVAGFVVVLSPFEGGARVSGDRLPDGSHLYPTLARALIGVSNGAGTVVLIVGVALSISRQWRRGPAARARCYGLGLIVLGAFAAGTGGTLTFLGRTGANAVGILVGVTLMFIGFARVGRPVDPGRHRSA
jgi:hypothetical protein